MARTADMRDFAETTSHTRTKTYRPSEAWDRFVWRLEGFGLTRFEREAGHRFSAETIRRMKAEHLARKPR